ncbi:MAG: hypothetical protein ACTIBT_09035, partial [Brevibacterium aurantiacum]
CLGRGRHKKTHNWPFVTKNTRFRGSPGEWHGAVGSVDNLGEGDDRRVNFDRKRGVASKQFALP